MTVKFLLPFFTAILLTGCTNKKQTFDRDDAFSGAKWIAYEQLSDNLKVVPAIHGSGDELGNKCVKRSVVPLFRKEFNVKGDIDSASINISGLGQYELYINGEKTSDRFLSPGWTLYQKRCFYNTYDITRFVKKGENAIGVLVGNGFYNINRERYRKMVVAYGYPRLIFTIVLKMKDGSYETILSDENCKTSVSPITFSSIYGGEDYDARMEQDGWASPGFDDSKWKAPVILHDSIGNLVPETDFPVKVMQRFPVKNITPSRTGRIIYDFGQNTSGIIALKVKGNRGAQIRIRPDELVNDQGNVTQVSGGGPFEFNYILKGGAEEEWQPSFSYYGFRYADVEIIEPEGADNKTEILDITMLHTRNSSPSAGSFSCSDTLFNRIFRLINWGIKSNMASVATDCPHREKLGWLEQTYLIGSSMHYNFDIHALYNKMLDDMMDSQTENGLIPDIAPEYVHFESGFRDSPEWGSAGIIIPWLIYKWYGDVDAIKRSYPMMKRYAEYLQGKAVDHILDYGLGDWYDLGPKYPGEAQLTPKAVTATAIYYYDLKILSEMSGIIGSENDRKAFYEQSELVRQAYLKKFYQENTGICSTGSQTAYAMSLYTGLIPEKDKKKVLNNLVNSIINNNYALTSGDIGYHFLVRVLSENGRSDILYKMNNRSDVPGYGYQLKKGATALTESWAALPTSSNDHMMLGHLMEWFYSGLGGIYQADNSVAYDNIIIAPKPVGDIKWVKCSYNSVKGMISSEWGITGKSLAFGFTIPEKSRAKIIIPEAFQKSKIIVRDLTKNKIIDVKIVRGEFEVTTGKYLLLAAY